MPKHKSSRALPSGHQNQLLRGSNEHPMDYLPAYADQDSADDQQELPEYAEGPSFPTPLEPAEPSEGAALGPSGCRLPPEKSLTELSNPAPQISRTFQLKDSKDNVRLSVTIFAPVNQKGHPIIHPGETIRGHLTVDAGERQKSVKSVVLTLIGRITSHLGADTSENLPTSAYASIGEGDAFLRHESNIWTAGHAAAIIKQLPFQIPFPAAVLIGRTNHPTPPTLSNALVAKIEYCLRLEVKHGMFRRSELLETPLDVYSIVDVEPPSLRRTAALGTSPREMAPGPAEDPDGWFTSTEARFCGVLFQKLAVEVDSQLYIAKPTVYQTGDIIPIYLVLRALFGSKSQVLDVLTNHPAIHISLMRSVSSLRANKRGDDKRTQEVIASSKTPIAMAVTWQSLRFDDLTREIHGEIRVPADSSPSFIFNGLSVEYTINLLPFASTGLVHAHSKPILSVPVEIVLQRAVTLDIAVKSHAPAGLCPPSLAKAPKDDADPSFFLASHIPVGSVASWAF